MKIQSTANKGNLPRLARGFSLFEMVIVMGIIGLILGGAIYTMGGIRDSAAVSTTDTSMSSLATNLEQYRTTNGHYPSTSQGLEALHKRPTGQPTPRRWIQTVKSEDGLKDAWGNKFKYQYPGSQNKSRPEIISAGPDGEFGNEDDQSNQDE